MTRRFSLPSRPPGVPRAARKSFVRVAVERLEDRTAPALFTAGSPAFFSQLNNNGSVAAQDNTGAMADFNGDGKNDIAVTNYGTKSIIPGLPDTPGQTVTVLFGNGTGGFGSPTSLSVAGSGNNFVSFVAIGDVNGDGKQDLVTVQSSDTQVGSLSVFLGNGAGSFTRTAASPIATNSDNPSWVGIADFTGDGKPDLAVASFGKSDQNGQNVAGNNMTIFQGDGAGGFTPITTLTNGLSFIPTAAAIADFDGDGKLDLAATVPGVPPDSTSPQPNGSVVIWLGNGAGGFSLGNTFDSGGALPINIQAADLNGDGKPDLVTACAGDPDQANNYANFGQNDGVGVLINGGGGSFGPTTQMTAGLKAAFAVAVADFDGDGKTDIAAISYGGNPLNFPHGSVMVYMGNGSGGFASDPNAPYDTGTSGGQFLAVGQFDGNSTPDLVAVHDSNRITTLLNNTTPAAATTTTLSAAPASPSTYGDAVTLTATVTSGSGTPTGTVTFLDGAVTIGTGNLNASGVATYSPTLAQLTAGTHSFTAKYGGAVGFAASTSSAVSYTVNRVASTTALTATPNPVTQGSGVTFTATVSSSVGTPTGTVTLWEGATQKGTGTLSNGSVSFLLSTGTWAVGDHQFVAKYADQANWTGSQSAAFTLTVNAPAAADTTTTLGSNANPSTATQAVTFTATVTSGGGTPTGTVTFAIDGVNQSPVTLSGGVATLTTSTLTVGPHTVTAHYDGATGFNPSTSTPLTQTVNAIATTITVVSSGSPTLVTQPVTFTATVAAPLGSPTGTVTFWDGGVQIGSGTLGAVNGQQVATFTTSALAVGTHTVTAKYAAQGNFAGSDSAPLTQAVIPVGTTVSASPNVNPATAGQTVTFTASIAPAATITAPPTGTVTFFDGTTALATVDVAGGVATFSTAALSVGTHSITAVYSGDANYSASTSSAVTETVNPVSPPPPPPPPPPSPLLVGYREFAVGADAGSASTVRFFNPDGSERFRLDAFPGFTGGVRTAAADFTGDGIADLVVGTGPGEATHVRVIDGVTQKELFDVDPFEASFTGGVYVAAGDVNGDGVPDLVITPDEGGGPRVRVFSGKGFGPLDDFFGIDDTAFRGGARAAVGDINGDGVGDLVVAAGFGGGPRVAAFDGKTIGASNHVKLFADFFAFESTLRNGVFITVGDVNGDGRSELIAGGGPGGGPRVTAFSGGSLLNNVVVPVANFFGGNTDNRGGIRLAVKNLDNDNQADLVVGDGTGAGSHVTGYLGKVLQSPSTLPTVLSFDAFPGFAGGVFVG